METQIEARHYRYMEIARKAALSANGNHKLGSVLVKSGRILSKGYNSYKNAMHSEVSTCAGIWTSELKDATLYVCRLKRSVPTGLAAPCPDCQIYIRNCKIKNVYFTDDFGNIKCWRVSKDKSPIF